MIFKIIGIGFLLFVGFCILSLTIFNKDVKKRMENREKIESIKISSISTENKHIDNNIFSDKKFTMVNVWGTYCSSCIDELPYLQEIYDEFKVHNVGMLGVISDIKSEKYNEKTLNKAKDILEKANVKYPNILSDDVFTECVKGKIFLIPTTLFVDSKGNVIGDVIESALSKEEYIDIIKKLLDDDDGFKVENLGSNMSCSIDGKCNY